MVDWSLWFAVSRVAGARCDARASHEATQTIIAVLLKSSVISALGASLEFGAVRCRVSARRIRDGDAASAW